MKKRITESQLKNLIKKIVKESILDPDDLGGREGQEDYLYKTIGNKSQHAGRPFYDHNYEDGELSMDAQMGNLNQWAEFGDDDDDFPGDHPSWWASRTGDFNDYEPEGYSEIVGLNESKLNRIIRNNIRKVIR